MRSALLLLLSSAGLLILALLVAFPGEGLTGVTPSAFVYPVMSPKLSSNFGIRNHPVRHVTRHHDGVDLAAPRGAQVRAIAGGLVVFADPYSGYGNLVVVKHSDTMTSHYGHLSTIKVSPGQTLRPGELIGLVGSTGQVTGPHLHFEIRLKGKAQDPQKYIPGLALPAQG